MHTVYALTSLSPVPWRAAQQNLCIASWRKAGLRVASLNHPSEIAAVRSLYDVEFLPVTQTSAAVFGKHYVPIDTILRRGAELNCPFLLLNSDIELRLAPWQMKRVLWLSDGGLCYFIRHNHAGNYSQALREPHGIDAFLLHGREGVPVPSSFLSLGQPFWDYLLPHLFATHDRPIWAVEFPGAFHQDHPRQWSWENWHRCALEFLRITGLPLTDRSFEACVGLSLRVRQEFESRKRSVPQEPIAIRQWVEQTFRNTAPKVFLELGSHVGTDTAWMAALPHVTIHAFEPDPRNRQSPLPNVILHQAAVADHDGQVPFIMSQHGWGQEWTHSSSIRKPKNHLARYPVTFGDTIQVQTVSLDSYCQRRGLGPIDFIWADIQGAEGDMIQGARRTLARTRYLYTEYSDDELYEGQASLADILALLPGFRVLELWPDDVLLENTRFNEGVAP